RWPSNSRVSSRYSAMTSAPGTAGWPSSTSTGVVPAGLSSRKASRRSHTRSSTSRAATPYSPSVSRTKRECGQNGWWNRSAVAAPGSAVGSGWERIGCSVTTHPIGKPGESGNPWPARNPQRLPENCMLLDVLKAIVLGVVEGLTEFIPVSSTGHLLLVEHFFGFGDDTFGESFAVLIQFGAVLALLSIYFLRLWKVAIALPYDPKARRFVLGVLIAFLPAMVIGALFYKIIKEVLFNPWIVCTMFIVGGLVLLWVDRMALKPRYHDAMTFSLPASLGIGFCQCLAMIPGVSRSGATIVAAMLFGADRRSATEFSFFLAMPTMLGAFVYELFK